MARNKVSKPVSNQPIIRHSVTQHAKLSVEARLALVERALVNIELRVSNLEVSVGGPESLRGDVAALRSMLSAEIHQRKGG